MGKKELNEAIIDVLNQIRGEIDNLPGLKNFHVGEPVYDEAIEISKDKVFGAIEDIITYIETDDVDEDSDDDEEDDQ